MKPLIHKILLSDRFILMLAGASLLVIIYIMVVSVAAGNVAEENDGLQSQLHELREFARDFYLIKDIVESKERKIGLTDVRGIVSFLERTLDSLGLEAKVIRPLETKRIDEYSEESAEMQIEDIDPNTIVSLLYEIEYSPAPVKIKRLSMKAVFENPDVFVLDLTASLISK